MEIVADLWWLWLLFLLAFGWLAIANQLRRIRGITRGGMQGTTDSAVHAFTGGLGRLFFYTGMAACAVGLLFISIILHLIAYMRP